jgi:hypothetical protein
MAIRRSSSLVTTFACIACRRIQLLRLSRRYRRHRFGGERHTGSQAPRHSDHAGLEHRRRFDDDGRNRRSARVAKGSKK